MLETKEQKQYFVTAVVLIIILSLVSLLSRPDFRYVDKNDYKKLQAQEEADRLAYIKYLETLKIDPVASKALFETLFTEEDIKKEVEADFKADQPVKKPEINNSAIKVVENSGQQEFVDYLSKTTGMSLVFGSRTAGANEALYSKDLVAIQKVDSEHQNLINQLYELSVPKEALTIHKALLSSFTAYGQLISEAEKYAKEETDQPWPAFYQSYSVINDEMKSYNSELVRLATGYKITDTLITPYFAQEDLGEEGFAFIKTAHALFGFGDLTITVGDIPRLIMDAIKEGVVAVTTQFLAQFLNKFIAKIEQNYLISNFLYYSDALVAGQYTDDYLKKYVTNQIDRQIIKRFIPQLSCGAQPVGLKSVFKAKAESNLGFDPTSLNPSDPKYFQKLAKVGDFMSSPNGWQLYFEEMAAVAKSEAEKAADKELSSSGLKAPRDLISKGLSASLNAITGSQKAGFTAALQIGSFNADSLIKGVVSTLTQALVNRFVFKGAVTNGGSAGVLKEQSVCLATAQLNVVLPTDSTNFQEVPPPPSEDDLIQAECAKYPRGCEQLTPEVPLDQTSGSPPEIP